MTTLTITAKGRVTLKKDLLKHLGVGPGEKIEVAKLPGGRIIMRAAEPNGTILDFIGYLSQSQEDTPYPTIEQMNNTIEQGWAQGDENRR